MLMKKTTGLFILAVLLLAVPALTGCGAGEKGVTGKTTVRVGHFPNITHSQALVGLADGTFERALGDSVAIERKVFNAGPAEMEALLAGEIDIGYIGPVPAINGFAKSRGWLKIIAGATNAGAVLVVREDAGIKTVADLAGKKVAVPQYGNTQDISLRKILRDAGLKDANKGGNVTVLQVENPDILTSFAKKQLDAAMVPEPWGSRLVKMAGGKILLDWNQVWRAGDYSTAVVIVRTEFLETHPDLVEKWLRAHVELTERIKNDTDNNKNFINAQLKELTKKELPTDVLDSSFSRLTPTYDPVKDSITEFVTLSVENQYLKQRPDIEGLVDLEILNKVLQAKGLKPIN